jgi:hypothetical protein
LTGVRKTTLKKMLDILREADAKKKTKGGCKSKLSIEDQLLSSKKKPLTKEEKEQNRKIFS